MSARDIRYWEHNVSDDDKARLASALEGCELPRQSEMETAFANAFARARIDAAILKCRNRKQKGEDRAKEA
jgi:hypothetical protein